MTGRSSETIDSLTIRGLCTFAEVTVAAADLDAEGVFSITPQKQGVLLVVDPGVVLAGIKVLDDDGSTDITSEQGGVVITVASGPGAPAGFSVLHESLGVTTPEHRIVCPVTPGNSPTDIIVDERAIGARYSSAHSRWVFPNWAL